MASVGSAGALDRRAPGPAAEPDSSTCLIGEIHTGILQNSTALSSAATSRILALVPGEPVRVFERPIHYALSPQILTGLDCGLAGAAGARARAVGTVVSRVAVTGGHVVQGSSFARLLGDVTGRRSRWSHYLAQPGVLKVSGRATTADLGLGFVQNAPSPGRADLAAISTRLIDMAQASGLDRRPPFRIARSHLRWTARVAASSQVHFVIENANLRTIRLAVLDRDLAAVVGFCEDLALHDWLLTCLLQILDRSRIGANSPRQVAHRLRPVYDHLLHLWMPAARQDDALTALWRSLDQRAGLSRQWDAVVARIRDQMGASSLALLDTDGLDTDGLGGSR
jgi:hypothetical protein